ncbi:hypothetical protein KIM372_09430 [Bombiscardovia nodaiensis]|uniref:Uncharacterized protein n=1 Tax=Bombiscardovia nodaiensis TaxID=2932181 RepID=A0ABN6SA35_9BIFI|nr:hypothetical protein KIM372_09430 [Bombiscardovia nodaiensis]
MAKVNEPLGNRMLSICLVSSPRPKALLAPGESIGYKIDGPSFDLNHKRGVDWNNTHSWLEEQACQ